MMKMKLQNILDLITMRKKLIDKKYGNWVISSDLLTLKLKDTTVLLNEVKNKLERLIKTMENDDFNLEDLSCSQQWDILLD